MHSIPSRLIKQNLRLPGLDFDNQIRIRSLVPDFLVARRPNQARVYMQPILRQKYFIYCDAVSSRFLDRKSVV